MGVSNRVRVGLVGVAAAAALVVAGSPSTAWAATSPPTTTGNAPAAAAETTSPVSTATAPASPDPTPATPTATAPPTASSTAAAPTTSSVPKAGGAQAQTGTAQTAGTDPNCDYYPQTGFSVCGAIRDHYNGLGGAAGFLGFPTSNETTTPDGAGKYNTFQNGNGHIYWSPNTPASEIGGAIFDSWGTHGYEAGSMGYPITDELTNPDGVGKRNLFQNAANMDYWSPASGAHQIGGVILQRWAAAGFELSPVGYPTTDERAGSTEFNGTGDRQNDFLAGSIYYNHTNAATNMQANPGLLTGSKPFFTTGGQALTDRVSTSVNVGTGNLALSVAGLSAPGVNGGTGVGITYNSLAQAPGNTDAGGFSFAAGTGWSASPLDTRVQTTPAYTDVISGDGTVWRYAGPPAGPFTAPPGANADLTRTSSTAPFVLTPHDGSATLQFAPAGGALTGIADRNGNPTTVQASATVTGPRGSGSGSVVRATRDANNRLVQLCQATVATSCTGTATRSATTLVVSYTYDSAGNLASVMDPAGKTTTFGYDTGNADPGMVRNLISITDPNGVNTRIGYDTLHRVTTLMRDTAFGGVRSQSVYNYITADGHTRVSSPNYALGTNVFTDYATTATGPVTTVTDPRGNQTQAAWTTNNQVQSATNPLGGTTTLAYSQPAGAAANPNTTQGEVVTGMASPMGSTWAWTYGNGTGGAQFLPQTASDPSANITTYGYNAAGNKTSSKNAMAATALVTYNTNGGGNGSNDGTVATSTDPQNAPLGVATSGASTTYQYDSTHNLTSITPPTTGNGMAVRTLTYDGFGRLATVTTATVTTTYSYDQDGRTLTETHTSGTPTISHTYDPAGNQLTQTDANGTVTTTYTKLNLPKSLARTGSTASSSSYTYDPAGNVVTLVDGRGTTRYHWDVANQLDQVTEGNGYIDIFGYNKAHQLVDSYYKTSGTNGGAATYDGAGNLLPPAGFAVHQQNLIDNGGRLQRTTAYRASANTAANRVADLSYCYSPQQSGQGCPVNSSTGDRNKINYATDNLTGAVTTYGYDKGGRLQTAVVTGGPAPTSYAYCYDASGNRTWEGATLPAGNDPCSLVTPTHTYNTVNQLTSNGATYDPNGNQTAPAPLTSSSYNPLDQYTAGSNTYGGATNSERLTTGSTTLANGLTGVLSTKTGTAAATYFERIPSGSLIAERGAGGEFYYVTDGLGSTVALVDTAGGIAATYAYDPQGTTLNVGGPNTAIANGNPYRYAGGYTDTTTGQIKFGARYYTPTLGRWTQLDALNSLLDFANGNRYAYAGDDPINAVDLTGLDTEDDVDNTGSLISSGVALAADLTGNFEVGGVSGAVSTGFSVDDAIHDCGETHEGCRGSLVNAGVSSVTSGVSDSAVAAAKTGYRLASDGVSYAQSTASGVYDYLFSDD